MDSSSPESHSVPITSDPASEHSHWEDRHGGFPWMFPGRNGFHGQRMDPRGDFMDPRIDSDDPRMGFMDPRLDFGMDHHHGFPGMHGSPFDSDDPRIGHFGRGGGRGRGGFGGRGRGCRGGRGGFGGGRPFPPPFGPHHHHRWHLMMKDWYKSTSKQDNKNGFKVTLNVSQFTPEDLKVNVVDGFVQVKGKHDERQDEYGYISREFTRRYQLPDEVDPKTMKSTLEPEGLLTVFAPKKQEDPSEDHEVPIDIDPKSPATEEADN